MQSGVISPGGMDWLPCLEFVCWIQVFIAFGAIPGLQQCLRAPHVSSPPHPPPPPPACTLPQWGIPSCFCKAGWWDMMTDFAAAGTTFETAFGKWSLVYFLLTPVTTVKGLPTSPCPRASYLVPSEIASQLQNSQDIAVASSHMVGSVPR